MPKFNVGDRVVLSWEGRREIPALRKKIGVVVPADRGQLEFPHCFVVEWGKKKHRMLNHEDNLELAPPRLP